MENRKVLAIGIMLLFAFSMVSAVIPNLVVHATVSGSITFGSHMTDKVAPGGPVEIDATAYTATGGSTYFYISKNDDPEISSGDVYVTKLSTLDDVAGFDSVTIFIPSDIAAYDNYTIKATDLQRTGTAAAVTSDTFEVPSTYPTVTTDPTSGNVGDEPTIDGTGADDYITVTFYWMTYDNPNYATFDVESDGTFSIDTWAIPNAYEGSQKIICVFEDDNTLATKVLFSVEPAITAENPDIDPSYSIEANTLDQHITVTGTGFPSGTVDSDSITVTVNDFMKGTLIDTYDTTHVEFDIGDTVDTYGAFTVDVRIDAVEAGSATLSIQTDSKTRTFEDAFLVSSPTLVEDFSKIKDYKMSTTEGYNGDDVDFTFINLPDGATIDISFIGSTVEVPVVTGDTADVYGAFKNTFTLENLPGDTYSVQAVVTADSTERLQKIGEFKILPKFKIWEPISETTLKEGQVEDELRLQGNGFPADSTIKKVTFGSESIDLSYDTGSTGFFLISLDADDNTLIIPHVSGGGKSVTVTIKGEDADSNAISAESSIIVNPKLITASEGDWTAGVLEINGDFTDFATASADGTIFPGNPVEVVGWGYLSGETVTAKLYDSNDKLLGSATITSGTKGDSSGDLELIGLLPVFRATAGKSDVYLTIEGATSTNTADTDSFNIGPADDANAKIFFGLKDNGDLDFDVNVADNQRIVGCGFVTKSLTLHIDETDTDIKDVTATNGYFETTVTIPEMEGNVDGKTYTLSITDTTPTVEFYVYPNIVLSPSQGYTGNSFTVQGTGFEDGSDVDINWVAITNTTLETVDGGDVSDGSFSISTTVPSSTAQAYLVAAYVSDTEWATASFNVLNLFDVQLNKTLTDIRTSLASLNLDQLNSAINSLKTDVSGLKTTVSGLQTDVTGAKTSADAAKTAADTATSTANAAKTSADSAKSAADSAKTAADNAKAAADNAKAASDGLTGLVYAAIAAAAVAAVASVGAIIMLMRKVVG